MPFKPKESTSSKSSGHGTVKCMKTTGEKKKINREIYYLLTSLLISWLHRTTTSKGDFEV